MHIRRIDEIPKYRDFMDRDLIQMVEIGIACLGGSEISDLSLLLSNHEFPMPGIHQAGVCWGVQSRC